tara:strand:- start:247 stop:549 length:303 start_codon:yes stop_codon:yes gene_type:complete
MEYRASMAPLEPGPATGGGSSSARASEALLEPGVATGGGSSSTQPGTALDFWSDSRRVAAAGKTPFPAMAGGDPSSAQPGVGGRPKSKPSETSAARLLQA